MDKYEYTIKSDKIKKLVERKDFETAVKIADTIDWERVRNIKMLSTVSLAYEKVSRFEEAKDLLLMAYECAPVGRRFLYKLTELAIKQGEFDEAEQYLKEFAATSPQDPSRLLLRYEIAQAKGEPTDRLITILEAYQKREFEERWSYELASLYYRVGKNEECVKLCDEIVLWFGVGTYVDKAMELKQRIAPLTPDQIEKRENKEKYLRRLEEVQREFEDKYRVLEEASVKAVEEAVQASQETAASEDVAEVEVEVLETEDVEAESIEEQREIEAAIEEMVVIEEEPADEPEEPAIVEEELATAKEELEEQQLHEEVQANLAREIEAATLTAALNEAVLRETAATMGAMEPEKNDHSQEHERTKVAMVHVPMYEKTKEFVREAKVIRVVLEEAQGRIVTADEVEARLEEVIAAEVEEEIPVKEEAVAEEPAVEASVVEEPVAEETPVEEAAVVEVASVEEPVAEKTEEVNVEEEPAVEESPVEEESATEEPVVEETPVEEEPAAEEPVVEETPVEEEPAAEEPVVEETPMEEAPVVEVAIAEETVEEEVPVEEEFAAEEPVEEPSVEEPVVEEEPAAEAPMAPTVRDHYVLVVCDREDEGVKECVSYIRRMRELLGYPVTQVAKIRGEKLATKNMAQTLRKLQGRDLVVVGIADLPDAMLLQTVELMAADAIESFIALVGTRQEIEGLQSRESFFGGCRVVSCVEEVAAEVPASVREPEDVPAPVEAVVEPAEKEISSYNNIEETAAVSEEDAAAEEQSMLARLVEEALRASGFGIDEPEQEPAASVATEEMQQESVVSKEPAAATGAMQLTPNEFYECAVQYAHMMDAKVDDMGGLAIYAAAEEYQQERVPLTEELAQELVENAIAKAERRTLKSLFSNRYDKEGFLILKEQHFKE